MTRRPATVKGAPLDPTDAPPEGLTRADSMAVVTFYGDFVVVEPGIGREGTVGWTLRVRDPEILTRPDDQALGAAVRRSLAASHKLGARASPPPRVEPENRVERAVGARSTTAFINGSHDVFVFRRKRRLMRPPGLAFYASRRIAGEGFSPIFDSELVSVDDSDDGIGRGVREALLLCT